MRPVLPAPAPAVHDGFSLDPFTDRHPNSAPAKVFSKLDALPVFSGLLLPEPWPSRVRSQTYSRSIPDRAASMVNTMPDGLCSM